MVNDVQKEKILQILSSDKNISVEQQKLILVCCNEQKRNLYATLSEYSVSETVIAKLLSVVCDCKYTEAADLAPMCDAVFMLPEIAAVRMNVLPVSYERNVLTVAVSDPTDQNVVNDLHHVSDKIVLEIVPRSALAEAIKFFYKYYKVLDTHSKPDNQEIVVRQFDDSSYAGQFIGDLLKKAIDENASDLHFEPMERIARVRYRIDGVLFNLVNFDLKLYAQIAAKLKIASKSDITEKRHPQDGRMFYNDNNTVVDIRVSTLPTIYGEKVVLRLLNQDRSMFGLKQLGFEKQDIKTLQQAIKCNSGLILVVGPTGSGKSTTLHALMEELNSIDCNIISIEDPVEYTIHGINQVQVNDGIGYSFSNILRSVLRQDPDKIMIGEIRDLETAQLAIRAALTGHLVLSTLHADNTVSAVGRLIDMGIQPYLLAASLKYVIAQRLVRKLCDNCKTEIIVDKMLAELLKIEENSKISAAHGCELCRNSGNSGRTVVSEILCVDNDMREMIVKGETVHKMYLYAIEHGMVTLKDCLKAKILRSEVSAEEGYVFDM